MTVIKCKMCGGDLVIEPDSTVAECEYCGSRQTVPTADNEKKLTLFARANRLRAACEFDKAAGIYETIVADFPEEAEAYWGLVLCKYGIEYVDDPVTGKKIPTCHRSSFDSVLEDGDFEQACENADAIARRVYREEAKQIEELRKGIIEVSGKEEPYDIFICYKETGENGERTIDSVIAQDVYDALTDKGYRVFFSRITLQGKLGEAYEPYIFAALNSAKVMLAVGTRYEYYNAVWVKNEWSRYLKLCEADKSKHLIPCYKDLDPEDMPREFNHLQGADLGKMGAVQDILFNMEKYIPLKKQTTTVVQEKVIVSGTAGDKIASLLDRGNMALEDGDWSKADSFFEDVLNNDSKNAQAYLGKTLAAEQCRTLDAFLRKRKSVYSTAREETLYRSPNTLHIRAMEEKYAIPSYLKQDEIRKLYDYNLSYSSQTADRKKQYRDEETYWANHKLLSRAEKFAAGEVAQELQAGKSALFSWLSENIRQAEAADGKAAAAVEKAYAAHISAADKKAEQMHQEACARREKDYQQWQEEAKSTDHIFTLKNMADNFDDLGDYADSKNLAAFCRKRIDEEQAKLDAEAERQQILKEKKKKERKAKVKKAAVISAIAVAAAAAIAAVVVTVVIPTVNYKKAEALLSSGDYDAASAAFEALGGFSDSPERAQEAAQKADYSKAEKLLNDGDYDAAITAFEALGDYQDSPERAQEAAQKADYSKAETLLNDGDYDAAITAFEALGDYQDSPERAKEAAYAEAETLLNDGDYVEAISAFQALDDQDAVERAREAAYAEAEELLDSGDYVEAISVFQALGDQDAIERVQQEVYSKAEELLRAGDKVHAAIAFGMAGDYQDAREQSLSIWGEITERKTIGNGIYHTVGLKADGTVVATGWNTFGQGQCDVSDWTDIVALDAGNSHTVGLKADGTVMAAGSNEYGLCDVSGWTDIVAVSAGNSHTVCLKADGTVAATGYNGLGECDVSGWTDIVAVSAGCDFTVGLKADGTVVATGFNGDGQCDVSGWTDIVAVSAGYSHTVGLKADGTVVATGNNEDGQCKVSDWTNIVAVSAGSQFTVGLKADGTVVAIGRNWYGQCEVADWTDIVAVSAGSNHTVGLKADSTVVAIGNNGDGQCDVSGWTNIKLPNSAKK